MDHHRGSEEQQPGWEYHDPETVDPELGVMDTLPTFRRTLNRAGLEEHVVALVGRSPQIAALWAHPLGLVFIDGGHTDEHASADYEGWAPHVAEGGLLVIHDVFPDPVDEFTGQAPYRVHRRALASGSSRRSPPRVRCASCAVRVRPPRTVRVAACRTQVPTSIRPRSGARAAVR